MFGVRKLLARQIAPLLRLYIMPDIKPFMIGLGGDSGSGKKTVSEAFLRIMGEDRLLVISMDAYHKWDREEMRTQTITHLNPDANHLDLALKHVRQFRKGQAVKKRIYDHSKGEFTEPDYFLPKKFVMMMGLHPFHLHEMRDLFGFKIFLSPDGDILKKWKLYRDVKRRGYEKEEVLKVLTQRKPDSVAYIRAQEQYADMVLNYFEIGDEPDVHEMKLGGSFIFKNPSMDLKFMNKMLREKGMHCALEGRALTIYGDISSEEIAQIADYLFDNGSVFCKDPQWDSGLSGLLQLFVAVEIDRRMG